MQKREELSLIKKNLTEGLDKLRITNDEVGKLKVEMTELEPKLKEQQVKTELFLTQLDIDKAEANSKEKVVDEQA